MIRLENLSKSYADGDHRVPVLNGLDLSIESSRFVTLLGRSGSGKSTLIHCIAGLERPDAGRIFVGDTELTGRSDRAVTDLRRERIGIIFQFFNLLPALSVLENVALPGLLDGKNADAVRARGRELLGELGLGDRAEARPEQLSGGEQQRVATARALINDPTVVLADEPTGNLDAATAEATLALLSEVNREHRVTILMATHSRQAASISDEIVTLERGRIAEPA